MLFNVIREKMNWSSSILRGTLFLLDRLLSPLDGLLARMSKKHIARIKIHQPIFIIGLERSGTTLLYSILANHPDLYWLSRLDSVLPSNPNLSSLLRRFISPILTKSTYIAIPGTISRSKGLLPPSECLPYWRQIFKWGNEENYMIEDDHFTEADVDEGIRGFLYEDFGTRLFWMQKKRLLFKQTGFCLKIRFLNAVFPDALFLHIIRDPFMNFLSLVRAKEASHEKFWGIKIPGWRDFLAADKRLQAAIQIRTTLEIIERDIYKAQALERYLQVKYEHLISNPRKTLMEVLQFCDLNWTDKMEDALNGIRRDQRKRPQDNIPQEIMNILSPVAEKYGYT